MTSAAHPRADQDPAADRLLEDWLAVVAVSLPGPVRPRQAVVAELRDGLLEGLDSNRARGLAPIPAARATLAEFGDPGQVAHAFAAELAAAHARRVALTLARTGPLLGVLWLTALFVGPLSMSFLADRVLPGDGRGCPAPGLASHSSGWSCSSGSRPPCWR